MFQLLTAWTKVNCCIFSLGLELGAMIERIWHDDVFVEVVWVRMTIALDFVNNMMNRKNWCLFAVHWCKPDWGSVSKNVTCEPKNRQLIELQNLGSLSEWTEKMSSLWQWFTLNISIFSVGHLRCKYYIWDRKFLSS